MYVTFLFIHFIYSIFINPRSELKSMSDFILSITAASGSSVPYIDYTEAEVPHIRFDPLIVAFYGVLLPGTHYCWHRHLQPTNMFHMRKIFRPLNKRPIIM